MLVARLDARQARLDAPRGARGARRWEGSPGPLRLFPLASSSSPSLAPSPPPLSQAGRSIAGYDEEKTEAAGPLVASLGDRPEQFNIPGSFGVLDPERCYVRILAWHWVGEEKTCERRDFFVKRAREMRKLFKTRCSKSGEPRDSVGFVRWPWRWIGDEEPPASILELGAIERFSLTGDSAPSFAGEEEEVRMRIVRFPKAQTN